MTSVYSGDPYMQICAVSVKVPNGDSMFEGSASGILIDPQQGMVLTHATVLFSLLDKCHKDRLNSLLRDGSCNKNLFTCTPEVEVILPNGESGLEDTYLTNDKTVHPVRLLSSSVQDVSRPFVKCKGRLKTIFECKRLKDIILKLMPSESWQFMEDSVSEENKLGKNSKFDSKAELCYNLLPFFIVIKVESLHQDENALSVRDSVDSRAGDPVEICATPFGSLSPEVFLNARSRGILSKVVGQRGVLLMTDARCVPGSEGGALFYCHKNKRLLVGIMIASLCWKNNEWVGLSLACAVSEVLGSMKSHLTFDLNRINRPQYAGGFGQGFTSRIIKSVRCVNVGHIWGSGVVIDPKKRLILTCSHVLNDAKYSGVTVSDLDSSTSHFCNIIYRTPLKSQFDMAVIQQKNLLQQPDEDEQLALGKAVEGEVVYMIGHAIFRGKGDTLPMVCRGVVSKIVHHNKIPVMIQTTCAVHAGASGGGVFNTHGQLIAMVVCNSKDTVSGASYPHVNMCIPMETVASVVRQYIKTEDTDILKSLHVRNDVVKRIWSIGAEECKVISHM